MNNCLWFCCGSASPRSYRLGPVRTSTFFGRPTKLGIAAAGLRLNKAPTPDKKRKPAHAGKSVLVVVPAAAGWLARLRARPSTRSFLELRHAVTRAFLLLCRATRYPHATAPSNAHAVISLCRLLLSFSQNDCLAKLGFKWLAFAGRKSLWYGYRDGSRPGGAVTGTANPHARLCKQCGTDALGDSAAIQCGVQAGRQAAAILHDAISNQGGTEAHRHAPARWQIYRALHGINT